MSQTDYLRPRSPAFARLLPAPVTFVDRLKRLAFLVDTWRQRHKSSMQCARVEAHVLRDLGISEAQRFIAVNKPFWEG